MTMPNIIMTRIDERLIHGQDATNSDENSCARLSCHAFLPFAKGD
ncbi:N-acetylgalactosamine-specific phosphotransferase EIIB [Streptococcus pneumoniae]|nr:N-acetylgalactosamine-specific phosphotransferase EIIB [Streptococcus pneumoniae]